MSSDRKVIAQAGDFRVLADGTPQALTEYGWKMSIPDVVTPPAVPHFLLADAVQRVREDMTGIGNGLEGLRVEMESRLTERIETLYVFRKEYTDDVVGLANEHVRLAARIDAVERAICDTRVDQGETGLVTECQEKNILRKIDGMNERLDRIDAEQDSEIQLRCELADRLAAVERNIASHEQEIGMTNEDVAMHSHRLRALEARQRDEAGEVNVSVKCLECGDEYLYQGEGFICDGCDLDASSRIRRAAKRDLAREIVERLRARRIGGYSFKDEWDRDVADWIERAYLGGE